MRSEVIEKVNMQIFCQIQTTQLHYSLHKLVHYQTLMIELIICLIKNLNYVPSFYNHKMKSNCSRTKMTTSCSDIKTRNDTLQEKMHHTQYREIEKELTLQNIVGHMEYVLTRVHNTKLPSQGIKQMQHLKTSKEVVLIFVSNMNEGVR